MPAPMPGSTTVPLVLTVMTQPVTSSVAVPAWKVHWPREVSAQVVPATTLALVAFVRVKGRAQLASAIVLKVWNSIPLPLATTVSVSGPPPPPPTFPKVSPKLALPTQVPISVGVPPSRLQATVVLLPPELLLPLLELPLELELEFAVQAQPHDQPRAVQVSALRQPGGQALQVSIPQLELVLLVPPLLLLSLKLLQLLLPVAKAQAHCQPPFTHWSFATSPQGHEPQVSVPQSLLLLLVPPLLALLLLLRSLDTALVVELELEPSLLLAVEPTLDELSLVVELLWLPPGLPLQPNAARVTERAMSLRMPMGLPNTSPAGNGTESPL